MRETGIPSTSGLFKPLEAEDILIRGERVKYDERFHWAILIQPFLETLAVLTVITVIAGNGAERPFGLLVILGAAIFTIYRLFRGNWSQAIVYATAGALLTGYVLFNGQTLALLAIVLTTGRFVYRALIWLLYERLYITNRRVIKAQGLLGFDISTMPLTRVTDINYTTTVPGELLGYASLRVETAGQDQALSWLRYLEKPASFYATLIDLSTAAVGSVTEADDDIGETEIERPVDPAAHLHSLDEDDGSGTLAP
jgi:uncharacterized membrane protein YdbT with pleckstrin-like domain